MRARQLLLASSLITLGPVSLVAPANAASQGGCSTLFGSYIACEGSVTSQFADATPPSEPQTQQSTRPATTSSAPPPTISAPAVQSGTNGQPCVTFYQEPARPGPNSLGPRATILANQLLQQYGLCATAKPPPAVAANPSHFRTRNHRSRPALPSPANLPTSSPTGRLHPDRGPMPLHSAL
jgi:hypothetical protein